MTSLATRPVSLLATGLVITAVTVTVATAWVLGQVQPKAMAATTTASLGPSTLAHKPATSRGATERPFETPSHNVGIFEEEPSPLGVYPYYYCFHQTKEGVVMDKVLETRMRAPVILFCGSVP